MESIVFEGIVLPHNIPPAVSNAMIKKFAFCCCIQLSKLSFWKDAQGCSEPAF